MFKTTLLFFSPERDPVICYKNLLVGYKYPMLGRDEIQRRGCAQRFYELIVSLKEARKKITGAWEAHLHWGSTTGFLKNP